MRSRQRGIADGWAILIGVVIVLALITAIVFGVKRYVEDVDAKAYQRGVDYEDGLYKARDNAELEDQKKLVQAMIVANDAAAKEAAAKQAAIDAKLEKENEDAQAQTLADIAAANDRTLILRDPGIQTAGGLAGSHPGGTQATAGTGTGQRDAAATGELSIATTQFLIGEADRADGVVNELTAAQQEITVLFGALEKCTGSP